MPTESKRDVALHKMQAAIKRFQKANKEHEYHITREYRPTDEEFIKASNELQYALIKACRNKIDPSEWVDINKMD